MTENNNKHRIYDKDDQNPKDKQNNAKKKRRPGTVMKYANANYLRCE